MSQADSTQRSGTFENEDGDKIEIYSLKEVLESHDEEEETATAVLGASDDCNCSYDSGYVFRQALYACKTCLAESNPTGSGDMLPPLLHGICLACSYECHANHELYELYTKRSFRCDCGNSRFANGNSCKLRPNKDATNPLNAYNHNFVGLYCVCNQPYPPPPSSQTQTAATATTEPPPPPPTPTVASQHAADVVSIRDAASAAEDSDEMLQCVICEDWFHIGHLKGADAFRSPTDSSLDDYEDVICHLCMLNKTDFLWYYQGSAPLETLDVNVVDANDPATTSACDVVSSHSSSMSSEVELASQQQCHLSGQCLLAALKLKLKSRPFDAMNGSSCFLRSKWRRCLCKCSACMQLYKERKCEYLVAENDSISYYEERGKSRVLDAQNKLISDELGKLNRVSQIELMHQFNDFKSELAQFLEQFARDGRVVKRENVVEFFDALNDKRKRRRLDAENAPSNTYYCK